jgi:hypothetical protein
LSRWNFFRQRFEVAGRRTRRSRIQCGEGHRHAISEYNTKPPGPGGRSRCPTAINNGCRYCLNVWEQFGYDPVGGAPVRAFRLQRRSHRNQDP